MARLTRDQIKEKKGQLSAWQTPAAMKADVEDTNNYLGSHLLFNQAGLEFLRDA